jgi:hypothetical protein
LASARRSPIRHHACSVRQRAHAAVAVVHIVQEVLVSYDPVREARGQVSRSDCFFSCGGFERLKEEHIGGGPWGAQDAAHGASYNELVIRGGLEQHEPSRTPLNLNCGFEAPLVRSFKVFCPHKVLSVEQVVLRTRFQNIPGTSLNDIRRYQRYFEPLDDGFVVWSCFSPP